MKAPVVTGSGISTSIILRTAPRNLAPIVPRQGAMVARSELAAREVAQ